MLFNSLAFLIFFPVVTIVYFLLPFRFRWIWLLIASYYFYMNWEPAYALLLFFCTAATYMGAFMIERTAIPQAKKWWLGITLILNFGILFFFKYYHFITGNVRELMHGAGISMTIPEFRMLLPVGISFYIFQAVGYTVDVYRGTISSEKHFGRYALFVAYFPHLVAGPINRSNTLLPEFWKNREFKYQRFYRGLRLIIYGFFMKLVVADRLAIYVDSVYNNADHHSGVTLLVTTMFFSFQIYCDFAGYSSIAIGASRIMGIYLMTNFRRPYLSTSVVEFWRRWHISLSTWFKDYLYISLGGNRVKKRARLYLNLMITFVVSGLWHGANWTFIIWGALNGMYLVLENMGERITGPQRVLQNPITKIFRILYVFVLITFAWIFFRSNSMADAVTIINALWRFDTRFFIPADPEVLMYCVTGIFMIIAIEAGYETIYQQRKRLFSRTLVSNTVMVVLVITILLMGVFDGGQFIYFQF
jgi:alginate O-acetyltransferase complex protein AlgI